MTKPRVVAIIQARMGSTRLPGKSLADISGKPLIIRVLEQVAAAPGVDAVVLATTTDPADDPLAELVAAHDFSVFRGHPTDVLSRYAAAASAANADVVVRVTGDCPLISPDTVSEAVGRFLEASAAYASNTNPYSRPDGQDVEVFGRDVLERANREAASELDREHVTAWIRRMGDITAFNVKHAAPPAAATMRWSVDHPADLVFVRRVWSMLGSTNGHLPSFTDIFDATQQLGPDDRETIVNEGAYRAIFDAATTDPAPPLPLAESEKWLTRSARVIPGGAQTYSKSWRQHIRGVSPIFLDHGRGARVWDVDGNEFVDLVQGLLPNILGYAHPEVDRAAYDRAAKGHSFSLPHPLEVELAERLVRLIPCAEMVRFGKNGSDATAGAVRIARAFTGRERIACCGYHGWQDWFIGATSRDAGIPAGVKDLVHPFPYNDAEALDRLLASRRGEFAAVIMEPVNFYWPKPHYLGEVKAICRRYGVLLIFDEICSGFHFGLGGAQKLFGVLPDLATFGKAMGNGYPISCVIGRADVMRTFEDAFVSFTFAGDSAGMAAAMTVLDILEHSDAYDRMSAAGRRLKEGVTALAACAGLSDRVTAVGHPHWPLVRFHGPDGTDDPVLKAFWMQEMHRRGVLILATHNVSASLTVADVDHVLASYAAAFKRIALLLVTGVSLETALQGSVSSPAFMARR